MWDLDDLSRRKGHRFPRTAIGQAVWDCHRFALNLRDVEDLLAEQRGIVSCEAIRIWCATIGTQFTAKIRRDRPRPADRWHPDEVVLKINGVRRRLWPAIDATGGVLDILVQWRRGPEAVHARALQALEFAAGDGDRQARFLSGREDEPRPWRRTLPAQGDQQRRRRIAPAHPPTKEDHGSVQVAATRPAVSVGPRPDSRHLPPTPSPPRRPVLPLGKTGPVRRLAAHITELST